MQQILNGKCNNAVNVTYKGLELEDLSNELLLEVFDNYDLKELLDAASANCRFRALIIQYYIIPEYRLNEQLVTISIGSKAKNNKLYDEFVVDGGNIKMYKPKLILNFLRNFGHLISRICIDQTRDPLK